MKSLSWVFGLLMLCNVTSASANDCNNYDDCCDPCASYCSSLSYAAYGDYLYWKVGRSDLNVGYSNNAECKYNRPDHDSGYRLGGALTYHCFDLGVRWTAFETDSGEKKSALIPAAAIAKDTYYEYRDYSVDFDIFDIEVGYALHLDCVDALLRPFCGVKMAWIDETEDIEYSVIKAPGIKNTVDYQGVGLYVGSNGKWSLHAASVSTWELSTSLVGRVSTAILDSDFNGETKVEDDSTTHFKNECSFNMVSEAFIGLDLTASDYCMGDFYCQIGYEVQNWRGWREFSAADGVANFGLGGLVVRLGASF